MKVLVKTQGTTVLIDKDATIDYILTGNLTANVIPQIFDQAQLFEYEKEYEYWTPTDIIKGNHLIQ